MVRLFFLALIALAAPLHADTLEERVARLEAAVAALQPQQTIGYYKHGAYYYQPSTDCAKITTRKSWYKLDFQFTVVKRVQCPQGDFVIAAWVVPAGYKGAGETSVDAFLEKDVIIP